MVEELQVVINLNTYMACHDKAALKRFKEDPLGELKKIGISVRPGSEAANYIIAQTANLSPTPQAASFLILR